MALMATNSSESSTLTSKLLAAFRTLSKTFSDVSEMTEASRRAERLFALSDAALAKRGLRRDQVINHAFRAYLAS